MGTDEITVNIWHWTAVWERDHTTGEEKLVDVFPTMARNLNSGVPREALFLTATSVGNPVAQEQRVSSVEDVNVRGFGSLTTQPLRDQNVDGAARWTDGHWEVVFVRDLSSAQEADVQLAPGRRVSIALAIWDGVAEDRNGQKSISIWQRLTLQE
jgi:DMSO reductase family type II enzyme heme b subunit